MEGLESLVITGAGPQISDFADLNMMISYSCAHHNREGSRVLVQHQLYFKAVETTI
jgi:hypothetical protein